MANYYCTARTNYVKVKDFDALEKALEPFEVDIVEDGDGRYALLDNGGDSNGFNFWDMEEDEPIDPVALLAPHLEDDEVWVFMEAGAEKMRYVVGNAFAFNNKGEERHINLNMIYDLADELGENVTRAEY